MEIVGTGAQYRTQGALHLTPEVVCMDQVESRRCTQACMEPSWPEETCQSTWRPLASIISLLLTWCTPLLCQKPKICHQVDPSLCMDFK